MSPRNALPPKGSGIVRPMDRTLDSLTETELPAPGTSVTRGTGGISGARTAGTSGTSDDRVLRRPVLTRTPQVPQTPRRSESRCRGST